MKAFVILVIYFNSVKTEIQPQAHQLSSVKQELYGDLGSVMFWRKLELSSDDIPEQLW